MVLLFSFSDKLTAKKQGRILKIYWFWISLIIFIKDTVLFKVFHQVNIIFVYNCNFFTKKHIIYNDERGEGDKTRWNSCQNTFKKWKQCRFCLFVFLYLRSVFRCALCISRNTFERIQLRGIAFKGDSQQTDAMLPCTFSALNHKWRQNVVRKLAAHEARLFVILSLVSIWLKNRLTTGNVCLNVGYWRIKRLKRH